MMDKKFLPPEDRQLADHLESLAQSLTPDAKFERELEKRLMNTSPEPKAKGFFAQALSTLGWAGALVALALILSWAIRTLTPSPPQPAAGGTPNLIPSPSPTGKEESTTPPGKTYGWNGTSLTLNVPLPDTPAEASVYNYQPEQFATLESARALAAQFGMTGAVYETVGEIPTTKDFLIVDGNQWLHVRSDQYFQYYPDYPRYVAAINGATPPSNAEAIIDEFMQSHSFDFTYKLLPSEIYGGYVAAPLTPDGHIVCYEYFKCAGLHFTLDEQGILYVDGILPKYEVIGQYGIISAEEAFQKILHPESMSDPATATGMMEGMTSFSPPIQTWLRTRPTDQIITLFGWLGSIPSLENGAPLVTLDGYTVTGNTADIPAAFDNTFIEATGQFRETNEMRTFALESWKSCEGCEDGLLGTISRQGEQITLTTIDDETLLLPDVPVDLSLPLESAFVIGVRVGETYEWKSIDLRNTQGGGGGGGGGLGFYKLNLGGAPVPFPTPEPQIGGGGGGNGYPYIVVAGDSCQSIAAAFGITTDELIRVNNLPADCSTLQINQQILIPGQGALEPQQVEGLRGMMNITIYKNADGSQRVEYGFIPNADPYPYLLLEGENLDALQAYQNKPVEVWGTVEFDKDQSVIKVERYEIPFPDLQFQILRGKQTSVTLNGQSATLFTADDGKTYVQFNPGGSVDGSTVGNLDDVILIEALAIPDETFGGYPALRIFSAAMAVKPKDGKAAELSISADQIYVVDEANEGIPIPPTATIERVELVYYMPDPRGLTELSPDQRYIQPAWLFVGHYSDGTEFFILVQALKTEFLLPEIAPYTQPG
jgi:hypothetical protein